jgi:O-antigen/teichoic acid export membrane protein
VPLVIMVAGQLVNALVGPVGLLLTMTGEQKAAVWILGVSAAVGIALGFLLIPTHGIVGAAWATTASRAGWNVAMAVAVWRRMGVRATPI